MLKPFYIKTDECSIEQIRTILELATNMGANFHEGLDRDYGIFVNNPHDWKFFGVDADNDTIFSQSAATYTLDTDGVPTCARLVNPNNPNEILMETY